LKSTNANRRLISSKISITFLITGIITLILSTFYEAQALALTGLGLTFFGVLFSLVRPQRYVEGYLLDAFSISIYSTIDRILKNFKYKGTGYYIPPVPETSNLPAHLKGLRDIVVFISANLNVALPSVDEISKGKFLIEKSNGIMITPPGSGLMTLIEKQLGVDFTNMQLDELCEVLPRLFIENLNIGKLMELRCLEKGIYMEIIDSLFVNLYSQESNLISVKLIGDPLVSAVACAITKASSKTITIEKQTLSPDGLTLEIWFKIMEG
jgi:hypothetical protein